jgi:hypothetical protein
MRVGHLKMYPSLHADSARRKGIPPVRVRWAERILRRKIRGTHATAEEGPQTAAEAAPLGEQRNNTRTQPSQWLIDSIIGETDLHGKKALVASSPGESRITPFITAE